MPVPARISIAALGVTDLARATEFYIALGWQLSISSSPEISFFHTQGAVLTLFPYDHLAVDAGLPPGLREGFGGVTLAINVETEDAVSAALDTALAAGGALIKPAARAPWGGFSGYFADLDGYPWEVAYNPFVPMDSEGRLLLP